MLLAAALLLAVLAVLAWWVLREDAATRPAAPVAAVDETTVDEATVAPALTDTDRTRIEAALVGAAGGAGGLVNGLTAEDAVLPEGSRVELDAAGASIDGDLARVPATVAGPLAGRWTVLLVRIDGSWRAYGSVRG